MIRVANIIEDARMAGPHLRIIQVGRRLEERGISTTVLHPEEDSKELRARLRAAGMGSVPIRLTCPRGGWKRVAMYGLTLLLDTLRLYRVLKRERFDVVHCSGGAWQIKGVIAGKLARLPVIWHLNDTSVPRSVKALFVLLAGWAVTGFIVAGERVRRYYDLRRWPEKPVFEIQAPVDTSVFDPSTKEADDEIAALSGIKIVTVANVNRYKGLDKLVDAAAILSRQHQDLAFVIVGPVYASQRTYLKQLVDRAEKLGVRKMIHFVGPKKDVARVLAATDISVCSSEYEASPMAVWEAMSMGRAVVSTDVGDVARFVVDGESGIVVKEKSAEALADGIESFLRDADLRASCGKRARVTAVNSLDVSVCALNHEKCYGHIVRSVWALPNYDSDVDEMKSQREQGPTHHPKGKTEVERP